MKQTSLRLHVNGQIHHIEVEPETPLLFVLRNDLGLKGVKYGCGQEQCGACHVLVEGQSVPTCKLPVEHVEGLRITTIEGLGTATDLHPLQEAFIEEQALQCGYCTPGMIIGAQGLLNQIRYPDDKAIREGLADHLCRCGVYDRARRAIKLRIGRPEGAPVYRVEKGVTSQKAPKTPDGQKPLPRSLLQNPELDSWIRINTDGTVTIFTGKVEFGQGIRTALAQIAAEELDLSLERIRVAPVESGNSPDEGRTVGSRSMERSGNAVRIAAAEARQYLLSIAFEELEVPLERLRVEDGTISDPVSGGKTTYWELFGGQRFHRQVTGAVATKPPEEFTVVGQPAKRLDLKEKVTGKPVYIHDLELPNMVHGRAVRPPHYGARLIEVDSDAVLQMPGVLEVVNDGSFLGIIAEREEQVVKGMETLQSTAKWEGSPDHPPEEALFEHLLSQPAKSSLVVEGAPVEDPIPPIERPAGASQTLKARYCRPYLMHASLSPSGGAALMMDGQLTLWVHTQGVYPIRAAVAQVLGMTEEHIRVLYVEGSGCYGHNGANDAALDAALLARALPGRPVLVKWTREDEHTWEPYGPAMVVQMQGSLDSEGKIMDWNQDVWSYTHQGRPHAGATTSSLLGAWHLAEPIQRPLAQPIWGSHGAEYRNADPQYDLPARRVVRHFVPESPLRTSSMRGLGAYANVFAIESFMDELAQACGADPVVFRLRHLGDERARKVIQAAAEKAGWGAGKKVSSGGWRWGQGMAFAQYKNQMCYTAVVVEVVVNDKSGEICLKKAVIAADAGEIVNPDGLSNQIEGGLVQSASWTLKEQVRFDEQGITSRDWESYPILAFPSAPEIETVLINRPGMPFLGSGEAAQGPTPAAIANAVFNAVGVRLRRTPFTPERVRAALVGKR